jgi:hypothetical protein
MNEAVLLTVIFPANIPYLDSFLESVACQSESKFDLVILNDGVREIPDSVLAGATEIIPVQGSASKIRQYAIEFVMGTNYDFLIFCDSDDKMGQFRVAKSLEYLETYEIVTNDLHLISENGNLLNKHYWSSRLGNKRRIDREFIRTFNILGLGNTAVRTSVLRKIDIPEPVIASDWYIFDHLLRHSEAIFTDETVTEYRQHNNTAGLGKISAETLRKSIQVCKAHYGSLEGREGELKNINSLDGILKTDSNMDEYVNYVQNSSEHLFWWELPNYF